ncbi:YbaB/EbfC family nucleoid-associated protein [Saccharothrix obliqua]|uniref:YbaB/EbfC family nucleoid-associated protein n=1 Tax=Saccharothrix obliqua TaxID=2861747 RepID=UPI001C605C4E|nr:YbaB/EbfC family nucleoid-associated protein [Saccharothrix obliqua]MBW4719735.1 YbaB/EbfC family nucleoid-associated protein [Saccharothrix obliqua]
MGLADMAARAERAQRAREALKQDLAGRVVTRRDAHGLVEIGVDTSAQVVEVAVNASSVGRVDPKLLAQAVLEAATSAQRAARELVAERRSYHLGVE